jgi:hypothetical protein
LREKRNFKLKIVRDTFSKPMDGNPPPVATSCMQMKNTWETINESGTENQGR